MKAKVKRTGRIIDVAKTQYDGFEWHYIDIETSDDYVENQLDFHDLIDWKERRYQIAKEVLCAFESNSDERVSIGSYEKQARDAVALADALIAELKKK